MGTKIIIAAFAGLLVGASCSDRATNDKPAEDTEERKLCVKNCDRQAECARVHDGTEVDAETLSSCVEKCMDNWFGERWGPCHAEALKGLTCETEAMCPQLYAPGEMCEREKYPWSGCRADPELWADRGCTYDTCLAGECCSDAPPPS